MTWAIRDSVNHLTYMFVSCKRNTKHILNLVCAIFICPLPVPERHPWITRCQISWHTSALFPSLHIFSNNTCNLSSQKSRRERGKSKGGTLLWQGTAINKRKGEGAALWISVRLSVPATTRLRQHDRCKFHQLMAGLATSGSLHMHSLWELIPFEMQGQRQD